MDENVNKVYINPNFNRPSNTAFGATSTTSRTYLHVNPHFSRYLPTEQPNVNRKIYVNPNFLKSNNIPETVSDPSSYRGQLMQYNTGFEYPNQVNNNYSNPAESINENCKKTNNAVVHSTSKSKYRLVRNNENKILDKEHRSKATCTVKISKYKSIPMHNFKTNLHITKHETLNKQKETNINIEHIQLRKYVNKGCFKLIRNTTVSVKNSANKLSYSAVTQSPKIKRLHDLRSQTKLRKVSKSLQRKNNIPCRLFTKYGKCLRNLSGICDYLHDKKHVSLCRKFIKGICHDKSCLLSHELSSKKMPTCYFYLKGMCTKDDCPYLHVKLSEKSKICLEFLKGYCDKGEKCPHRHIKPRSDKIIERKVSDKNLKKHSPYKTVKLNVSKLTKINQRPRQIESQVTSHCKKNEDKCVSECRYYFKEDLHNGDEISEVVKPSRCKLGTLPSYIKL